MKMIRIPVVAILGLTIPAGALAQTINVAPEPYALTAIANHLTQPADGAGYRIEWRDPLFVPASLSLKGDPGTPRDAKVALMATQAAQGQNQTAERRGFIIGFGAGPAVHRRAGITIENQSGAVVFSTPGASSFAVVTDFKVGYAPTDQLLVYYQNLAAFTRDERYDVVGFSGGAVTYMARPTSPTAFVSGGIGIAAGRDIVESTDGESGVGYSVSAGWEFSRHWSIDGGAMFVRLGENDNHTVLRGGVHYLFY